MYKKFLRPLFFLFDPEAIHHFSFAVIKCMGKLGLGPLIRAMYQLEHPSLEREVFGLKFKNPVGLAAGFDKNAALYNELSDFGFGFVEIGTLTPKPQDGNPKKRLFRLKKDQGIINRMGFNNHGVHQAVKALKKPHKVLIGGNIGKNKHTPNDQATSDYLICLEALFSSVDYFVVNVSSPNTPGLRALQEKKPLMDLLHRLMERKAILQLAQPKLANRPLLLKIAPDLTDNQLLDIIEIVAATNIDGVIASNTTLSREGLASNENLTAQAGGLSGRPVRDRSTQVIRFLFENSKGAFPIIGVGGIHSAEDALEKLHAGASLVQLWTGFVYEGPALIKDINKALVKQAT
ncbi:MAG: quinone-dependent dihydroorotate dehydrogenase [Flavobacteriaceae bacterium]|nr:quinone-dependent dihydroorotate dehydrogenase [Flavobacteriaceae bacterium]MCI5087714.1 quinone-dependent dihydroorotate dehydrogenase [Flavobacteriaceae bacterium]